MDLESIPSLEDELENIKNVTDQDFSEQKDKARENFDSIPEKINNETQDFVDEVLVALNDFQNQTEDGFHELDDFVQDFEEEINGLDDDDIWEKIKQIDDYRYYTCIGLACLTLLIVIFNIVGMAMGTCGTKKSAHPMERTRLSNAGGNTLVAGAAFSFFFSWLLVLLVMIMFFALGNIAQLCEPLNTLELFEETIDQPGLITDGYWLGDTLYPDENSNLTVSGLLEDCGRDEPLYDALQLVHFFNVSELTEYKEELGIEEKLDSIDINLEDIDIFTTDMEKALRDFQDALNDTSFTDFTDELSNNVTNVDLTEYADTIDNLAANISDDATRWALTNDSQELRRIDKELVEPMEDAADHLVVQLTALEKINDEIQSSIDVIIVEAQAAEDQINSNDTEEILVNTTHLYAEELLLVTDDYVNYAVTQITEEVARCLPVRTIYDSAVVILCNYSIDALNLIWFTLGWCVFFYVPSIIYGVKLAKYYRIMHKEYPKNKKEKKKAKKNQTDSVAMKDMNSDADTADGLDTNHLVVHDQPNHYNGASNKDYSGHANPQYMHDDPIMAYNHPMSARAVPPPPYNDGHQGRGIPAAYQHRVLPYTSNDYSDRSRPYINHQPSAFQRYSQQTDEQNDLNAPDHHHHLSGYYDSLEDSESYNYLKPAKATRNPLYYEHPASGMDIPASAGQIDIDNWTYGNQQMNGGRPMSTGAGFPRNINHLY
uniref:Prominin-1-A n=1 Tax=Saccoglossus kowalevskii TaxID=10224 RepID=A0ABM0M8T1_SACKO|nr:PREDICTED: prominin-1-A [Saccoglossus kowalevskii]